MSESSDPDEAATKEFLAKPPAPNMSNGHFAERMSLAAFRTASIEGARGSVGWTGTTETLVESYDRWHPRRA